VVLLGNASVPVTSFNIKEYYYEKNNVHGGFYGCGNCLEGAKLEPVALLSFYESTWVSDKTLQSLAKALNIGLSSNSSK